MSGRRNLPHDDTYMVPGVGGRLYQTDADGKLIPIPIPGGVEDGWVVSRNTTTNLYELRAPAAGGGGGGISTGTPGDLPGLPLYTGLGLTIDPVLSGTVEHYEHKITSRKYHNFASVGAGRLQAVIIAGATGGKLAIQLSANGGSVWFFPNASGSGPWVATDAIGYPIPGDFFTWDVGAQLNNLLVRLVTIMPGGIVTPFKHGVVWLDLVSSAAPPPTEVGSDPDLPEDGGTTWGSIIMDHNVNSISTLANGAREATGDWPDDSGGGHPAMASGTFQGMEYHESGFGGGPAPYMQAKTTNYGDHVSPAFFGGEETMYLLCSHNVGAGTALADGSWWQIVAGGAGENMTLHVQSNQKLYMSAGGSAFGTPQAEGTAVLDNAKPYVLRITHAPGSGNARCFLTDVLAGTTTQEINLGDALIVNGWNAPLLWGSGSDHAVAATFRCHRRVRYNKAHNVNAGTPNTVELAIIAAAGL